MAGMAMTSIIAATIDENSGRCIIRPAGLEPLNRPRTAKASGVVASATKAAESAAPGMGRLPVRHDIVPKNLSLLTYPSTSSDKEESFVEAASKPRGWSTQKEGEGPVCDHPPSIIAVP